MELRKYSLGNFDGSDSFSGVGDEGDMGSDSREDPSPEARRLLEL